MKPDTSFWHEMGNLIAADKIVIDRPKGARHPRYPDYIYPLDYGYLENTIAGDGDGIDVWIGSHSIKTLTGILCTFDTIKRDAEIKLLIACTDDDVRAIRKFHHQMVTLFIPNPLAES